MKTKSVFISAILLWAISISSCQYADNSQGAVFNTTELSPADKEQVKREIAGRIDEIIKGCKQLNADTALNAYWDSADFVIVNTDGSVINFQTMKNTTATFFKSAKYVTYTTVKEDFKFLSKSLVMCTWTGREEYELKTGEHMKADPYVGSMLFSKIGNEWKIVYAHESSTQPVKIDSAK
jgi:hypothetical protein